MTDLLVRLYSLPDPSQYYHKVEQAGILLQRPLSANKGAVLQFVESHFSTNWVNECDCIFSRTPIPCFIARKNDRVLGFAAYDSVCLNFFGPTGVAPEAQGSGIGAALLLKSLYAMRESGYGYAIIGWADGALPFYRKIVDAIPIPDSMPGIYWQLL